MGELVMTRVEPRGLQGDRLRTYRIEVDGIASGRLHRRTPLTLQVSPGRHQIQARIDWQGSEPMDVVIPETGSLALCVVTVASLGNVLSLLPRRTGWLRIQSID